MKFEREIHEQYQKAYAMGLKNLDDKKKRRLALYPASLSAFLDEKMVSYRMELGILEIPTNLIVGISEETEDALLYTKEFLPISAPNTVFADIWRTLYKAIQTEEAFSDEIFCYEYLGKFYVCDGLKRVSVAKYVGLDVMKAKVVRILPVCTDSQETAVYFHFLHCYRHTKLYQLQFTQGDSFEKLQKALGRKSGYCWSEADRSRFLQHWPVIERAFRKSYEDSLCITAADALVVLLDRYSFDQIISMDSWMLARVFQTVWKDLYALSFPQKGTAKMIRTVGILQTA